jgi:hypothetical protein
MVQTKVTAWGRFANLPGTESPGRLQTCPTLPVASTPQFLNHAYYFSLASL